MFIFQSFISTNVRQCFCPPSIDPQRTKKDGGGREADRKGGSQWLEKKQEERCTEGGVEDMGKNRERKRVRGERSKEKQSKK